MSNRIISNNITLKPWIKQIDATLDLPGSKSIANRVLLLAALAKGVSIINNIPEVSEDVMLMLNALAKLGVKIEKLATHHGWASYKIFGCGGNFKVKTAEIFCGNSGTTIRFLCAVLAVMDGEYILTGVERMQERPILDLIDALKQIGADIYYQQSNGFPPVRIGAYKANDCKTVMISGNTSSQYVTAVLMALPLVGRNLNIEIKDGLISRPYVSITLDVLKLFGCQIGVNTEVGDIGNYIIKPILHFKAVNYTVEPDASSASYFLAIGALRGSVTINNLGSNSLQGDKKFVHVLAKMGAKVEYLANSIKVSKGDLFGITINMEDMPDVAMTIAVLAIFAKGATTINGIRSWMVKETDRLQAMHNELAKLGAKVNITDSSITIIPPLMVTSGVAVDTYHDHRMAMCFSLIAAGGIEITINNFTCVAKTFANYFDIFLHLNNHN